MFFFFKQKTAYEMRISDWSSDVCSSDLRQELREDLVGDARAHEGVLMAVAVEDQQLVAVARRQLLQAVEAEDVGVGEDAVVTPGHEQNRQVDTPCMVQVVVRSRRILGLVRIHLQRQLSALYPPDSVAS